MAPKDKLWKVIDVINWGKQYFNDKGIDSPRLSIELLLCKVLNSRRIELYSGFERYMTPSELEQLRSYVMRRVKHEPLQYIIGCTDFLGLEIAVNPSVLIPRPETELMVSIIIDAYKNKPPQTILDIGSGSGCIALALARSFPEAAVLGADISPAAVETANLNAQQNNIKNVEFIASDVLKSNGSFPYSTIKRYDLVVSNPPYIDKTEHDRLDPEVRDYEPEEALTDKSDGLTFYRKFSEIFPDILTDNGEFYLEIGYGQKDSVIEIFRNRGIKVLAIEDYSQIPRIVTNSVATLENEQDIYL